MASQIVLPYLNAEISKSCSSYKNQKKEQNKEKETVDNVIAVLKSIHGKSDDPQYLLDQIYAFWFKNS